MKLLQSIASLISCLSFLSAFVVAPPAVSQILPAPMPGAAPHQQPAPAKRFQGTGSGILQVQAKNGKVLECPLKHTQVNAAVSGYIARVTVKQTFSNPFKKKIDAVYTFPLSDTAAVDEMWMKVGSRTIHGTIKKKEEARAIYEKAKAQGHVAALLDQERPNIFTQSVANIESGKEIEVTLSYVDLLPYENGKYTFTFPTVVGPRFIPGGAVGHKGTGFAADTAQVPDASKITPHEAPPAVRSGHDILISVHLNAGVPIGDIHSALHEVDVKREGASKAEVTLKPADSIANKDFVLSWAVAGDNLHSGYLTNASHGSGYFVLMIMPPKKVAPANVQPKEMIFLIDCSGSQQGKPLDKAKETMLYCLDHMNSNDTFQIIAFNNTVTRLFAKPHEASDQMRQKAKEFVNSLHARGGTWMAPAVEAACREEPDDHRLRIVSFMTDGYVGNDMEIVGMIKKLRGTSRWFPFGTGNSVNRFLIDNIARAGGGEPDYVYLQSSAAEVGKKFYDEIASPVLTDVKVDFGRLEVKEVFPHELSDVWAQRPLYIVGRYVKPGKDTVTIEGFSAGKPYTQKVDVELPGQNANNKVLGSVWARAKVDRLMAEDFVGAQRGTLNPELKDEIIRTALEHHIITQYTSFVAVEEKRVTREGKSETVEVPVESPEGVQSEYAGAAQAAPAAVQHRRFVGNHMAFAGAAMGAPRYGTAAAVSTFGGASMSKPTMMLPPPAVNAPMMNAGRPMPAMVAASRLKGVYHEGVQMPKPSAETVNDKTTMEKLSAALKELIAAHLSDRQTNFKGITLKNSRVHVKLTMKDTSESGLYGARCCGAEIEEVIFGNSAAMAWVRVDDLIRLASDPGVVSIAVAD